MKTIGNDRNPKISTALGSGMILFILLGGIGTLFAFIPDPKQPSILGLITIWILSFIIVTSSVWNRLSPNWWAELISTFALVSLFLAAAIHGLGYILSNWLWVIPLVGIYLFAWVWPVFNSRLAKTLHTKQTIPQTNLGQGCTTVILSALGIAGSLGGAIGISSSRLYGSGTSMLILGILATILSIGLAQYYAYYLWAKWARRQTH